MNHYKGFITFWIPILKKQVFKAKMQSDNNVLLEIRENIWNNWNFTKEERNSILGELWLNKIGG